MAWYETEPSPECSRVPLLILRALCKSVAPQAAGSDDVWYARRRKVLFKNITQSILHCFPTAAEVNGLRPKAI